MNWDGYECDGQMSLFDLEDDREEEKEEEPAVVQSTYNAPQTPASVPGCFAEYVGRCDYCLWGQSEDTCHWFYKNEKGYKRCDANHSRWEPNVHKIKGLCGNCHYYNNFHYEGDMHHPEMTSDIYCTLIDGPVNRTRPFADFEHENSAPGLWNRQIEYWTCDAYKEAIERWVFRYMSR